MCRATDLYYNLSHLSYPLNEKKFGDDGKLISRYYYWILDLWSGKTKQIIKLPLGLKHFFSITLSQSND